jgi:hypothetical protein
MKHIELFDAVEYSHFYMGSLTNMFNKKAAEAAKKFKDVVGKGVTGRGARHAATIDTFAPMEKQANPKDGGSWDMPYRMLVPQNVENMLVAGKHVCTDRDVYMRFLPETMTTGQAAGVAAAVCAKKGITPRELEKDISEVQKILEKQGAVLHTKY